VVAWRSAAAPPLVQGPAAGVSPDRLVFAIARLTPLSYLESEPVAVLASAASRGMKLLGVRLRPVLAVGSVDPGQGLSLGERRRVGCATNASGGRCGRSGLLMRCCIGDGGASLMGWWASAVALQGEAANHPELLRSRAVVVSVGEQGAP
jgi:hypothetical protein